MEVAQLVGHAGERAGHRIAHGVLPVGEGARDRHREGVERALYLAPQRGQFRFSPAEQAAREQDLARQTVAHHP
jgi:hypothetical protein